MLPLSFNAIICDALRDLVTFKQFQKREKLPWSVTFSKGNTPP